LTLIVTEAGNRNLRLSDTWAQENIKFLAFVASYDVLYDTALGMYDWELAKMVARNSQKDPRVYMVEVERLGNMEETLGKYTVDMQVSYLTNERNDGNEERKRHWSVEERRRRVLLFLVSTFSYYF